MLFKMRLKSDASIFEEEVDGSSLPFVHYLCILLTDRTGLKYPVSPPREMLGRRRTMTFSVHFY